MFARRFFLNGSIYPIIWLLVFVLMPLSTSANFGKYNSLPVQKQQDSVLFYIGKSKDASMDAKLKLQFLEKGLHYAQNTKSDSLRSIYFSRLSYAFYQHGDSTLFRKSNSKAIILAKKRMDSIAIAEAYWDLGSFFQKNIIRDSAYYAYSQAQKIYEGKGNAYFSGRMLINMADQQEAVKDYVGSESNIILAIERLKPLDKFKYLYFCYNNLGIVAKDLGEYDKAIQYLNEASFYANKLDTKAIDFIGILNNFGMVYTDSEEYPKAIEKFKEVLASDSLIFKNPILHAKTLTNLAFCKIKIGDTLGVYDMIQESIKIKESKDLEYQMLPSYRSLTQYYLFKKDTIATIATALHSKQLALDSYNNKSLLETLAFLLVIDVKNASKYGQAYIALNDSLQKEERQARNKFAKIRFETDEFIAENELLFEEKQELSKDKQILAVVAACFFLLGLSVYVIINQRIKNQKLSFHQQQQANNQEIFNLMLAQKQKVDEVKQMEQKRISEELHDGVLGKMLGARMVLTGLNKKPDDYAIEARSEAILALKNIENELRAISHELSHSAYQKLNNFVNSVHMLLESSTENSNIKTIFNYSEDEDWDSLKGDIKINIYRIIQECLQNTVKHSGCTNFFINFTLTNDSFLVTIGDNGKGFSLEKQRQGIGIRNISSRVEKMEGTWSIDTALEKGVVIHISVPAQFIPKQMGAATNPI